MDVLTLILRVVRETIEATGAPPDPLQDALAAAEDRLRRSVGGNMHHISRTQDLPAKVRVIELLDSGLTPQVIAERLDVSRSYVYRVQRMLRDE